MKARAETQRSGQAGPAHLARVEQRVARSGTKLIERTVDDPIGGVDEGCQRRGRIARHGFIPRRRALRVRQSLAASVGEQPVERSAGKAHVEADRRGAARTPP